MAGKLTAQGAGILLVTANVGSLFEDPENLQKMWLREFCQTVQTHRPLFVALHCQEVGGKNYEASMTHVDSGAVALISRALIRVSEHVCMLISAVLFILISLHAAKKFRKVVGKEVCSDALPSTATLEKEKFPQDYFPECKWSRKGFIRTRWALADCAFDLVNIHLFHDASNLVAWEKSPSVYSGTRQKALGFVLDRITDQRFERLPHFIFGDFNFRLDSKQVIEVSQTLTVSHTLLLKFTLLEFDRELYVFKERLHELDISFPPSIFLKYFLVNYIYKVDKYINLRI
uniref:inositol-polyphosphate 5-phosphatase n=1 Tax=Cyprinus carpio TaxID=7962 RepID=A0A8C1QUF3_CYPCA